MQRWGKENGRHLPKGSVFVSTWLRRIYFYLQIEYSSGKRIRNASCLHQIHQEGICSGLKVCVRRGSQ